MGNPLFFRRKGGSPYKNPLQFNGQDVQAERRAVFHRLRESADGFQTAVGQDFGRIEQRSVVAQDKERFAVLTDDADVAGRGAAVRNDIGKQFAQAGFERVGAFFGSAFCGNECFCLLAERGNFRALRQNAVPLGIFGRSVFMRNEDDLRQLFGEEAEFFRGIENDQGGDEEIADQIADPDARRSDQPRQRRTDGQMEYEKLKNGDQIDFSDTAERAVEMQGERRNDVGKRRREQQTDRERRFGKLRALRAGKRCHRAGDAHDQHPCGHVDDRSGFDAVTVDLLQGSAVARTGEDAVQNVRRARRSADAGEEQFRDVGSEGIDRDGVFSAEIDGKAVDHDAAQGAAALLYRVRNAFSEW